MDCGDGRFLYRPSSVSLSRLLSHPFILASTSAHVTFILLHAEAEDLERQLLQLKLEILKF
ncbi:unnamed protein product, partial [Nesidiocoris tenuis]